MALADTGKAISAVTEALIERLGTRASLTVTAGRPDIDQGASRLNLFLYEIDFDPSLKNIPLDEGQPPPLWLVLKYLMTAFDDTKESDSSKAYGLLGEGLRALQELNYLFLAPGLPASITKALVDNPEELKVTFDETPVDLLSKFPQGSDGKYRLSVAFQVRPVMIATGQPASYALLVGVDYTTTPAPSTIGEKGVVIPVLPSLGPALTKIVPESFEADDIVTIYGTDLHLSGLSVMLGAVELPIIAQKPDKLKFKASKEILRGAALSAGSQTVSVVQAVTATRRRSSNLLIGNLLPILTTASVLSTAPGLDAGTIAGVIELGGLLLGKDTDDVFLALYRDGRTYKVLDAFMPEAAIPGPPFPTQTRKRIQMKTADAVPQGTYLGIVRVNGAQAKQSLTINLV